MINQISGLTMGQLKVLKSDISEARKCVRKQAKRIYTKSGRKSECAICKYPHTQICHIKPIAGFDLSALVSEINRIDNLIALCPNHHFEMDNNLLQ